ncbi:hypothetical protein [Flavobacterium sp. JP2137]
MPVNTWFGRIKISVLQLKIDYAPNKQAKEAALNVFRAKWETMYTYAV